MSRSQMFVIGSSMGFYFGSQTIIGSYRGLPYERYDEWRILAGITAHTLTGGFFVIAPFKTIVCAPFVYGALCYFSKREDE